MAKHKRGCDLSTKRRLETSAVGRGGRGSTWQISLPRLNSISEFTLAFHSFSFAPSGDFHGPTDFSHPSPVARNSASSYWKQTQTEALRVHLQLKQQRTFSPRVSQNLPHAPSAYEMRHGAARGRAGNAGQRCHGAALCDVRIRLTLGTAR